MRNWQIGMKVIDTHPNAYQANRMGTVIDIQDPLIKIEWMDGWRGAYEIADLFIKEINEPNDIMRKLL